MTLGRGESVLGVVRLGFGILLSAGFLIASLYGAGSREDTPTTRGSAPPKPLPSLSAPSTHPEAPCAAGCRAEPPPSPGKKVRELGEFFTALGGTPPGTPSSALDEVLFAGDEASRALVHLPPSTLSSEWRSFLEDELSRTRVRLSLRIRDARGELRVSVSSVIRLGERTHVHPDLSRDLSPPETTLTARRVGLGHIWTRL